MPTDQGPSGTAPPPLGSPASPPHPSPFRRLAPADLLAGALFAAWALLLFVRIHYGFDLSDEGMYLSSSDRLAHGDLPFRDDAENPLRQFDVLDALVALPWGGFSLLGIRSFGIAMQITQMLALWLVVRRWLGPWAAALTAGLVPCVILRGMWTPGYNEWACATTVVAACALALAGTGGRRGALGWGAVAGIAFGLDWLTYAPTAALAVVPLALAGWGFARDGWHHPWTRAGAACLAVAGAVVALDVGWMAAHGLLGAWRSAIVDCVVLQQYLVPLPVRLGLCWDETAALRLHLLATIAALALLRWLATARSGAPPTPAAIPAARPWLAGAVIIALITYYLVSLAREPAGVTGLGTPRWIADLWYAQMVLGLSCVVVFLVPDGLRALRGRQPDALAGVVVATAVCLLFVAISTVASTLRTFNGLHIRAAVLVLGLAGFAAWLRSLPPATRRPLLLAGLAAQLALAATTALAIWHLSFLDADPDGCTMAFTHPPLAGVRSQPGRVIPLETVQTWVDAHEPADALLLAYHNLPGLYFALGRRPALVWTWTDPYYSTPFVPLLDRMQAAGRTPAFCVRNLTKYITHEPCAFSLDDPVHRYVCDHFRTARRIWPYEILVPRIGGAADPAPLLLADLLHPDHLAPSVRILLPPTTDAALASDGTLSLTTTADHPGFARILCRILVHGDDELSLRLRIATDSTTLFALPQWRQQIIQPESQQLAPTSGYDITFPATPGETTDRGFALFLPPPTATGTNSVVIRHLTLEQLPPAPQE